MDILLICALKNRFFCKKIAPTVKFTCNSFKCNIVDIFVTKNSHGNLIRMEISNYSTIFIMGLLHTDIVMGK